MSNMVSWEWRAWLGGGSAYPSASLENCGKGEDGRITVAHGIQVANQESKSGRLSWIIHKGTMEPQEGQEGQCPSDEM